MRRTLSSSITPFYKLIPVLIWCVGLFRLSYDFPKLDYPAWLAFLLFASFVSWLLGFYKRVAIEGDTLYVSNYLKEVSIPLTEVQKVDGPDRTSAKEITLTLRDRSEFGGRIRFTPRLSEAREIADELKRLVAVRGKMKDDTSLSPPA